MLIYAVVRGSKVLQFAALREPQPLSFFHYNRSLKMSEVQMQLFRGVNIQRTQGVPSRKQPLGKCIRKWGLLVLTRKSIFSQTQTVGQKPSSSSLFHKDANASKAVSQQTNSLTSRASSIPLHSTNNACVTQTKSMQSCVILSCISSQTSIRVNVVYGASSPPQLCNLIQCL